MSGSEVRVKVDSPKKERVRHLYSLMCEMLVFGQDKRLSMINVIANIRLPKVPAGIQTLGFVCNFIAPVGDKFIVSVEDPKRVALLKTDEAPVEPSDISQQAPHIIKSTNVGLLAGPLIFRSEGIHHIVLRVGGRVIHREPFGVFVDPFLTEGQTNDAAGKAGADPGIPDEVPAHGKSGPPRPGRPDNRGKRPRRCS